MVLLVSFEYLSDRFGGGSIQNHEHLQKLCQLDNDNWNFYFNSELPSSYYNSNQDNNYVDEHDYKQYLTNPTIERKKQV